MDSTRRRLGFARYSSRKLKVLLATTSSSSHALFLHHNVEIKIMFLIDSHNVATLGSSRPKLAAAVRLLLLHLLHVMVVFFPFRFNHRDGTGRCPHWRRRPEVKEKARQASFQPFFPSFLPACSKALIATKVGNVRA